MLCCRSSQWSLCYCIYPLIRLVAARPCARPCARLRVFFRGTPWQCVLARPLCRCQAERGFQTALCLHASDARCVPLQQQKSRVVSTFQKLKLPSACVFQRRGACHTTSHRSRPLADTAPPARPPPRARRGRARPRVHDSHNSGPPPSTLISWGPMDRDSTRGSYVSNSVF